jgi:hypothetical protein
MHIQPKPAAIRPLPSPVKRKSEEAVGGSIRDATREAKSPNVEVKPDVKVTKAKVEDSRSTAGISTGRTTGETSTTKSDQAVQVVKPVCNYILAFLG